MPGPNGEETPEEYRRRLGGRNQEFLDSIGGRLSDVLDQTYGSAYGPSRLTGGDKPQQMAPVDTSAAVLKQIMDKLPVVLSHENNEALAAAVKQAVNSGQDPKKIVKDTLANVAGAIGAGQGLIKLSEPENPAGNPDKLEGAGLIKLANGNYYNPQRDSVIGADGTLIKTAPLRSGAQDAADNAQAQAHLAQAGYYGAQAAQVAKILTLIGTSPREGYAYDGQGNIVRTDLAALDLMKEKEVGRHNLETEINNATQTKNTAKYQEGQLANDTSRLGIEGRRASVEEELGRGRLNLDTRIADENAAVRRQQNELAKSEYISKILSNPSDFIARSFAASGQASPQGRITQADLINQINGQFNQSPQTFVAPTAVPGTPGVNTNTPMPAFANGTSGRLGYVNDKMAVVGDSQVPGVPNPEVIHNPTGAPIAVEPMNQMQGQPRRFAEGTPTQGSQQPQEDPRLVEIKKKVDSLSKLIQHVETTETQHALVDELGEMRGRLSAMESPQEPMQGYARGTSSSRLAQPPRAPEFPGWDGAVSLLAKLMGLDQDPATGKVMPRHYWPSTLLAGSADPMGPTDSEGIPAYARGTTFDEITDRNIQYDNASGKLRKSFLEKGLTPPTGFNDSFRPPALPAADTDPWPDFMKDWLKRSSASQPTYPQAATPTPTKRIAPDLSKLRRLVNGDLLAGDQGFDSNYYFQNGASVGGGNGYASIFGAAPNARNILIGNPSSAGLSEYINRVGGYAPEETRTAQEILVQDAEKNMSNRLRGVFGGSFGKTIDIAGAGARSPFDGPVPANRLPFNLFTPEALGSLTTAEQKALNSYLGVKYNTDLDEVLSVMKQSYGSPKNMGSRLS